MEMQLFNKELEKSRITDISQMRLRIPGPDGVKIDMKYALCLVRDLIGKDLSLFSLPVFINEPLSIL